jgi:hypothetical protein
MFLRTRSTDLELKCGLAEAGRPEPLIRVVNFANLNREPVRNVGNFRNFPDFPNHLSILPQSSADFKKIISHQIIECRLKASQLPHACRLRLSEDSHRVSMRGPAAIIDL